MDEARVALFYTDFESELRPIPSGTCTLQTPKCIWKFRAIFWDSGVLAGIEPGDTKKMKVVFRPDGLKLEDADARVYAGKKRVTPILVWEPPHNSMQTKLVVDINENIIRCRKQP
jgi:hypothetical protein